MSELSRNRRITFMLNEEEHKTVSNYLSKYHISNRSRWCREVVISHVLKMLEQDYPMLFSENEMRR
ncbi:MAG: hypothetical protein LBI82_06065 [Dysgonamonadaceae bacterium]|jgi:hypothetical protein|nr:hypothetical protein [Dysgonamonadaceae bacterium]